VLQTKQAQPKPWNYIEMRRMTLKLYRSLIGNHDTPEAILDIWKTRSLPRPKFFAWLLLHQRLNTKDLMVGKTSTPYVEYKYCVLCDTSPEETLMHLFFECSFSQSFWWALGTEWNTDLHIHNMILDAKTRYSKEFIMEFFIRGCWSLWDQRSCVSKFMIFCSAIRAKPRLKEGMQAWLDTL
jgi:hypothetical protein